MTTVDPQPAPVVAGLPARDAARPRCALKEEV